MLALGLSQRGECLAGCGLGNGIGRAKDELETSEGDEGQQGRFL